MSVLIMFRSLTSAQRGSHVLERAGIAAPVAKAPQSATDKGCTYCIRVSENKLESALDVLESGRIQHGRILRLEPDGYREVFP